jgi:hypothetical protein
MSTSFFLHKGWIRPIFQGGTIPCPFSRRITPSQLTSSKYPDTMWEISICQAAGDSNPEKPHAKPQKPKPKKSLTQRRKAAKK